jgi:hypothetical protein
VVFSAPSGNNISFLVLEVNQIKLILYRKNFYRPEDGRTGRLRDGNEAETINSGKTLFLEYLQAFRNGIREVFSRKKFSYVPGTQRGGTVPIQTSFCLLPGMTSSQSVCPLELSASPISIAGTMGSDNIASPY